MILFLLDEFQDTSYLQWKNMHPLLVNKEDITQGSDSLIVGDVKQSIYRWRNSDWKILGEEIAKKTRSLSGRGWILYPQHKPQKWPGNHWF